MASSYGYQHKTSSHGVTATASNRVELQLDFDNVPTAATKTFDFDGVASGTQVLKDGTNTYQEAFDTNLETTLNNFVTTINNGSNSYTASRDGNKLVITAGSSGNNQPDFDSGLTFQVQENVAEVDTVTLNANTQAIYSAIEITDGTSTSTVIQTTADAAGHYDQLKDKIAAVTTFSSDVNIGQTDSSTATNGGITFTAAEAGRAISGTYGLNQLVASAVTVAAGTTETQTVTGSSTQRDVFTLNLDSGDITSTSGEVLEHNNVLGTNGGVVELTFTSSEGTGVVYQEMDSVSGTTATTDTLIAALAAKINARTDFAFSAAVDANGDLALTAGANGAGVLTTNTVALKYINGQPTTQKQLILQTTLLVRVFQQLTLLHLLHLH